MIEPVDPDRLRRAFEIMHEMLDLEAVAASELVSLADILDAIKCRMSIDNPDEVICLFRRAVALQNTVEDEIVHQVLDQIADGAMPLAAIRAAASVSVVEIVQDGFAMQTFDAAQFLRAMSGQQN
jgi:hypothetical protein